jgi:hypothetical protein
MHSPVLWQPLAIMQPTPASAIFPDATVTASARTLIAGVGKRHWGKPSIGEVSDTNTGGLNTVPTATFPPFNIDLRQYTLQP